nr:unnamed protein product [Digitaria exilis]
MLAGRRGLYTVSGSLLPPVNHLEAEGQEVYLATRRRAVRTPAMPTHTHTWSVIHRALSLTPRDHRSILGFTSRTWCSNECPSPGRGPTSTTAHSRRTCPSLPHVADSQRISLRHRDTQPGVVFRGLYFYDPCLSGLVLSSTHMASVAGKFLSGLKLAWIGPISNRIDPCGANEGQRRRFELVIIIRDLTWPRGKRNGTDYTGGLPVPARGSMGEVEVAEDLSRHSPELLQVVANEAVERHEDDRADEPRAFFSRAAGLFAAPLVVLAAVLASAGGSRLTPTTGCSNAQPYVRQMPHVRRVPDLDLVLVLELLAQEQAEQPSRGPKQPAQRCQQGIRVIPFSQRLVNGRTSSSLASARCGGGAGGAQRSARASRARGGRWIQCERLLLLLLANIFGELHSLLLPLPFLVATATSCGIWCWCCVGAVAVLRLCGVVLQFVFLFTVHLGRAHGSSVVRRSSSSRVAAGDVPLGIDVGSVSPSTSRFDDSDMSGGIGFLGQNNCSLSFRWQIKTRMWLTDLKLFWVVAGVVPEAAAPDADDAAKATAKEAKEKWDKANQACLSRLLNIISNRLFNLYSKFESAKALWTELESEFSEVDNGNESFATESYLNYKMVEGRSVMEQLQELQLLVRDLVQYNRLLPDSFQVNAILAKLPSSWRDFVTARRHMKTQLTLPELTAAINVEERARVQAHMVERGAGGKSQKKKKERAKVLILSAKKEMWWLNPPLPKSRPSSPVEGQNSQQQPAQRCQQGIRVIPFSQRLVNGRTSSSLASARCGGGAGGAQQSARASRARGGRWIRCERLLLLLLAYIFGEFFLPLVAPLAAACAAVPGGYYHRARVVICRSCGIWCLLRLCGVVLQFVFLFTVHLGQVPRSSAVWRSSSSRVAAGDVPLGIDVGSVSPSTSRFDDSDVSGGIAHPSQRDYRKHVQHQSFSTLPAMAHGVAGGEVAPQCGVEDLTCRRAPHTPVQRRPCGVRGWRADGDEATIRRGKVVSGPRLLGSRLTRPGPAGQLRHRPSYGLIAPHQARRQQDQKSATDGCFARTHGQRLLRLLASKRASAGEDTPPATEGCENGGNTFSPGETEQMVMDQQPHHRNGVNLSVEPLTATNRRGANGVTSLISPRRPPAFSAELRGGDGFHESRSPLGPTPWRSLTGRFLPPAASRRFSPNPSKNFFHRSKRSEEASPDPFKVCDVLDLLPLRFVSRMLSRFVVVVSVIGLFGVA